MALTSATSCASRVTLRPFASRSASGIDDVDDHAEDRESGSLDVGRLGADERRHSFDSGFFGRRALQHRKDARFDESGNLHRVDRFGKGMLNTCN